MNFLANLIERHLPTPATQPQLATLQPRLPSRFEPASQTDAPVGLEHMKSLEQIEEHDSPTTTRSIGRITQRAAREPDQQPSLLQPPNVSQLGAPERQISTVQEAFDAARATIQPATSPIIQPDQIPAVQIMADEREASQRGMPAPKAPRTDADDETSRSRSRARPTVWPEVRIAPPQPRANTAQVESRAHEAEPVAPTIRVTIGRVDVRAVMANATPPARPVMSAPQSDKLSLEDYLHGDSRNGGAR